MNVEDKDLLKGILASKEEKGFGRLTFRQRDFMGWRRICVPITNFEEPISKGLCELQTFRIHLPSLR
jgi:hypothetical protein